MPLHQNAQFNGWRAFLFSYQSECHCAKTFLLNNQTIGELSYQSECHCAKTLSYGVAAERVLSYQSECHCAKT